MINDTIKEFNIKLNEDPDIKKLQDLKYNNGIIVNISNKSYIDIIKSFSKEIDYIDIIKEDNILTFNNKETNFKIVLNESLLNNVKSKFSYDYLKHSIFKLTNEVSLSLSNDYPLQLDYKIYNKLNLRFILAPRVNED